MPKKYINKYTLLLGALVLVIGVLVTGSAMAAETVPWPDGTFRTITGDDFGNGIDLNAKQLAPLGTSSLVVPHFTGFDSPWVLNAEPNDAPVEIADDAIMHGIVDVKNGMTNNAARLMPNLNIVSTGSAWTGAPSTVVPITFSVRNNGTADATSFKSRICIDNPNCIDSATGSIGESTTQSLAVGNTAGVGPFNWVWSDYPLPHKIYFATDVWDQSGTPLAMQEISEKDNTWSMKWPSSASLNFNVLTPNAPATTPVYTGTTDFEAIKINLTGDASYDLILKTITFERNGWARPGSNDVTNLRLYDYNGTTSTQISGSVSLSTTYPYTVTFSRVNLFIPAGTTKTIGVKVDINPNALSDILQLRLKPNSRGTFDSSNIYTTTSDVGRATINGTAPASGDRFQITSPSLNASLASGNPAGSAVPKGSVDITFAKFDLAAVGRDLGITKIYVNRGGASSINDYTNVKLLIDGTSYNPTSGTSNPLEFVLPSPLPITNNSTKTITVIASIKSTASGSTINFSINASSIYIIKSDGTNSTIGGTGFPIVGNLMTIVAPLLPDLVAQSKTTSPTTPRNNTAFVFSTVIKNQGTANASATQSTVSYYYNGWIDSTVNTPAIAAGSSATISFPNNIYLPGGVTYPFKTCVNVGSSISESNTSNNCTNFLVPVSY